jgi:hypothetical protein
MAKETNSLLEWRALEHNYVPKNNNWVWAVSSSALALLIAAILMRNFLLGVFAVLSALVLLLAGGKKPRKLTFSITRKGVKTGSQLHAYKNLESFWIFYKPPEKKELILSGNKIFSGRIRIPLADVDPNLVRKRLLEFLEEREQEESLLETIADKLGF